MTEIIYPPRKIEEIPYPSSKRYLMEISFDGSAYGGWQIQPNSVCVQEIIQKMLCRLFNGLPIELTGSSRTDAGVHAINFAAAFPVPDRPAIPPEKLKQALNRLLPPDIRIRTITEKPLTFHARFDAMGKAYVYVINIGDETPFSNHYSLHPKFKIDIDALRECAEVLIGTHDFSSFVCSRNDIDDAVRTIYRIEPELFGDYLCISYVGNGFLYKMIRCLTGALLECGSRKMTKDGLKTLLEAKDRTLGPTTASARGLFLVKVFYEQDEWRSFKLQNVPFFI